MMQQRIASTVLAKDLIAELLKFPGDTEVTVPCYEFGFTTVETISSVQLVALPERMLGATHVLSECESDGASPIVAICIGDLSLSYID